MIRRKSPVWHHHRIFEQTESFLWVQCEWLLPWSCHHNWKNDRITLSLNKRKNNPEKKISWPWPYVLSSLTFVSETLLNIYFSLKEISQRTFLTLRHPQLQLQLPQHSKKRRFLSISVTPFLINYTQLYKWIEWNYKRW